MLPWSLGENGIDASAIVRTTFDKREWKQLDLGGVIIYDMARLSQYFSVFILHDNSPRKLLNFNDTILAFINYSFNSFASFPRFRVCGRHFCQHYVVGIVHFGFDRRCKHCDANGARRHELHFHFQSWIIVIFRAWEVEHLHLDRPISIYVERLTRRHPVAFPFHATLPFFRVEFDQTVRQEIGITEVIKIRGHVLLSVHQVLNTRIRLNLRNSRQGSTSKCNRAK